MAKCNVCGAENPNEATFCTTCGAKIEKQATSEAQNFVDGISDKFNEFTNTADTTSEYDPEDIKTNTIFAVLSYLGILCIVPVLAAKDSRYARFHANQGVVLFIAQILSNIVFGILGVIPIIKVIAALLAGIVNIIFLVLVIIGIINAVQGKAKQLPIIGTFNIIK